LGIKNIKIVKIIKREIYLINPDNEKEYKILDVCPFNVSYEEDITAKELKEQILPSVLDDYRFSKYSKHKEEVGYSGRMNPVPDSVKVGKIPIVIYRIYLK